MLIQDIQKDWGTPVISTKGVVDTDMRKVVDDSLATKTVDNHVSAKQEACATHLSLAQPAPLTVAEHADQQPRV